MPLRLAVHLLSTAAAILCFSSSPCGERENVVRKTQKRIVGSHVGNHMQLCSAKLLADIHMRSFSWTCGQRDFIKELNPDHASSESLRSRRRPARYTAMTGGVQSISAAMSAWTSAMTSAGGRPPGRK